MSPTSYKEPTSSTITSLTEPSAIPSITTSASPFPIDSTVVVSPSVWRIPSLTSAVEATIPSIVNDTDTSLVVEFPLTTSPSIKVPTMFAISNSVTETDSCWVTRELTTIAVAPDVWPVMIWFSTSLPSTPEKAATRMIVFWFQSPPEFLSI